ncbi:hypothetical protein Xen7305DRAFT_00008230 [Xenococcus sp. PCC 7305]|nr:hypothetical protein Xen7305DRAFT_00008230 [Xenococcus sp. PCC 7305]
MPTATQMLTAIATLQSLSNFYRPIFLFRYDEKRKHIFIIAGEQETIEITIFANGNRRIIINEDI